VATVYTIGHSTRAAEDFVGLLREHGIRSLADVRRFPGSRRHPHFGREALEATLPAEGIGYHHFPELGGRRDPRPDSANTGWRNASFRAYADYMEGEEFGAALYRLIGLAGESATAVMCAEAVPWRCHRNLIADALVARGHDVVHVLAAGDARPHALNPLARIRPDGSLVYPADEGDEQPRLL
jgi:uncharacterized protein (DUF488 family)